MLSYIPAHFQELRIQTVISTIYSLHWATFIPSSGSWACSNVDKISVNAYELRVTIHNSQFTISQGLWAQKGKWKWATWRTFSVSVARRRVSLLTYNALLIKPRTASQSRAACLYFDEFFDDRSDLQMDQHAQNSETLTLNMKEGLLSPNTKHDQIQRNGAYMELAINLIGCVDGFVELCTHNMPMSGFIWYTWMAHCLRGETVRSKQLSLLFLSMKEGPVTARKGVLTNRHRLQIFLWFAAASKRGHADGVLILAQWATKWYLVCSLRLMTKYPVIWWTFWN